MTRFKLTGRSIFIIIVLNLLAVLLAVLIPQRMHMTGAAQAAWQAAHPRLAPLAHTLGLHHVFTTPWFGVLLFLFFLALVVSLQQQTTLARQKITGIHRIHLKGANWHRTGLADEQVAESARQAGYKMMAGSGNIRRFIKYPWGYAGNVILHLGMVVTIAASLAMVLLQQRGLLHLYEGEMQQAGSTAWVYEEHGLLTKKPTLPESVVLTAFMPEQWERTGELKQVTSEIRFITSGRESSRHVIRVNRPVSRHGFRIYQATTFGRAFFLEIKPAGQDAKQVLLEIENPQQKDKAGYGNLRLDGVSSTIKAKYFSEESTPTKGNSLQLRLEEFEAPALLALAPGESGFLGPYRVRLLHVADWTAIIFTRFPGISWVFLGFFLIIVGSGLIYFFPVRELLMKTENNRIYLQWRPGRFIHSFSNELDSLFKADIQGEG